MYPILSLYISRNMAFMVHLSHLWRSRYHECKNPEPAHGGSDCQGNDTEIDSCSIKFCPGKFLNCLIQ